MDERSSASSLVLSPKLVAEVEAAAADEQRPAQDIMRDAVMGYVKTRRWQKTLAYGSAHRRLGSPMTMLIG